MRWVGHGSSMPIRVAGVPHSQVYIRHCGPLPGTEQTFVRLPDPRPARGDDTEQSGWWPPAMLEEGWIERFADTFDLMHIHFGFDALPASELARVVRDLRRAGKPLVYTVHDLNNPHHSDPAAHRESLDVLISQADALITLTTGAAGAIRQTWGREPLVLPHPHVVPLDEMRRRGPRRQESGPRRLGVHLKSLRPNMEPRLVIDALAQMSRSRDDLTVQVNTHPEVATGELGSWLGRMSREGLIDLQVRPYFDEDQLWDYLQSLDGSVLPYRWGTHSGWLEACLDLGTAVIAPDCGFYADQRPVASYHLDRATFDPDSLAAAVDEMIASRRHPYLDAGQRSEERRWIADAHEQLYRSLLDS